MNPWSAVEPVLTPLSIAVERRVFRTITTGVALWDPSKDDRRGADIVSEGVWKGNVSYPVGISAIYGSVENGILGIKIFPDIKGILIPAEGTWASRKTGTMSIKDFISWILRIPGKNILFRRQVGTATGLKIVDGFIKSIIEESE